MQPSSQKCKERKTPFRERQHASISSPLAEHRRNWCQAPYKTGKKNSVTFINKFSKADCGTTEESRTPDDAHRRGICTHSLAFLYGPHWVQTRITEHGAGDWKKPSSVVAAWKRESSCLCDKNTKPCLTLFLCGMNTISHQEG